MEYDLKSFQLFVVHEPYIPLLQKILTKNPEGKRPAPFFVLTLLAYRFLI